MYYISINVRGHYDVFYTRKMRKLEIHVMYQWSQKHGWTKVGTYTTEQIDNAIKEKTLWKISRKQSNTLITGGTVSLAQIDAQNS